MSDIRNLLPDPKPAATVKWDHYASKDVSMQMLTDNRLHITNNSDIADSYIYTQIALPKGVYRFGAEVSDPQNGYASNLLRMVVTPQLELDPAEWNGKMGRVVTPANKVDTDSTVEFRVMVGPNAGSKIWVRHLFVMTDSDYQQMIDAGIEWFDGDSHINTPPPLSGLPLWPLATIWSWGWQHEPPHHAHKRPTSARLQELCNHAEPRFGDRHACGTLHLPGHGRVAGGHTTQPLCAGKHRKYTNADSCMGEWIGVGVGRDHTDAIQDRLPIGFSQGQFRTRTISTQRDRRIIHTPASRTHDERRNGRIPCNRTFRRILFVSRESATRLGVAA